MKSARRSGDMPLYKRYAVAVAVGGGGGLAATLLAMCLFALALSAGGLPGRAALPLSGAALAIGAFSGGFLTARLLRERGLLAGAATGIWLFMLCCAVGAIAGVTGSGSAILFRVLIAASAAAIGGIAGVNVRRRVR